MPIRKKLFTKTFYEKNFPELAKQGRLPEAGYARAGGRTERWLGKVAGWAARCRLSFALRGPFAERSRLTASVVCFSCVPAPHSETRSYPDMGEGPFSHKLSMGEWFEFANAQRAHYNYVEGAASALLFLVVSGLFFPRFTALCGLVYIVGRAMYGAGYKTKGQRQRCTAQYVQAVRRGAARRGAVRCRGAGEGQHWSRRRGADVRVHLAAAHCWCALLPASLFLFVFSSVSQDRAVVWRACWCSTLVCWARCAAPSTDPSPSPADSPASRRSSESNTNSKRNSHSRSGSIASCVSVSC